MNRNDRKNRLGVVFSTNSNYNYAFEPIEKLETLSKNQQKLRVNIEKNGRGGKIVTIIKGFIGDSEDLKSLGKLLKTKCGVGGSVKDCDIMIQGNLKDKIVTLLKSEGYSNTK